VDEKKKIDNETFHPNPAESECERISRLEKRIEWELEISTEDMFFMKSVYPMYKLRENREEFIPWLNKKIESQGFILKNAPTYLKKAYKSNNPNKLPPPVYEEWSNYIDQKINLNDKKVFEEYLENKPTKKSEGFDIDAQFNVKEIKYGERGGKYTEDTTKDGRPYRRYF
tara:strand:+ start:68 stop:577 length:510 start_codon:yes stop_codon:yes gene_type:complete